MRLSNAMDGTGDHLKEIVVCRDRDDLGQRASAAFVRLATEAISLRGRFSIALAGGVTPRYVEKLKAPRLTLTLPVLNQARQIFFLAAGKEKAPVLRNLLAEASPLAALPARRVQPDHGKMTFFLDQEAACLIGPKGHLL